MQFLIRPELDEAIRRILGGSNVRCAVAFWGRGLDKHLLSSGVDLSKVKIICNLRMGGTNPHVIRTLWMKNKERIKQLDILHAKVYISNEGCVVTSANASANGMGLEGIEQEGWIEAGVEMRPDASVVDWFERLWNDDLTRKINEADLDRAEEAWQKRRLNKPSVGLESFADFDLDQEVLPLVEWYTEEGDYELDKKLKQQAETSLSSIDVLYSKQLEYCSECWPEDKQHFQPGRLILWWRSREHTTAPNKRTKLTFSRVERIIQNGYVKKASESSLPKFIHAVLPAPAKQLNQPFDPNEPNFRQAFLEVICRPEFPVFSGEGRDLHTRCATHLRPFWKALRSCYLDRTTISP